ncbi:NUC169 domain-containing protein [Chytriomyces sp. MP71]|nr:NUC169 domain-containing protein [Chytriomyces sp. MP71]
MAPATRPHSASVAPLAPPPVASSSTSTRNAVRANGAEGSTLPTPTAIHRQHPLHLNLDTSQDGASDDGEGGDEEDDPWIEDSRHLQSNHNYDDDDDDDELPEIIPDYASDDSDEETHNTIGNVPLEWYADLDHIGYDIHGNKIAKPAAVSKDQLDAFLDSMDDPDSWRSVFNKMEGENVVLTDQDLDIIKRVQSKMIPDKDYDPYEPAVDWFSSKTEIAPLSAAPEPKSRFIPSKNEAAKIMKIVRSIKKGWKKTTEELQREREQALPKFYDIWQHSDPDAKDAPMHIPAPRMPLPDHRESYNPPIEYIPTPSEIAEWHALDAELRPQNYIPKKHPNLRSVGAYERFVNERFDRCLDLYLCPRMIKNRVNVDPESLIPQLPSRRELEPYPKEISVLYRGHTGRVRAFGVDPSGKWLASGGEDRSVRVWEVLTGRCVSKWVFEEAVQDVKWNPNVAFSILAVAVETDVFLLNPGVASKEVDAATDDVFVNIWGVEAPSKMDWKRPSAASYGKGHRVILNFAKNVTSVVWHRKGDYFSTVCPDAGGSAVSIHQISKRQTQHPFKKSYGLVQKVQFHPKKPWLFVATQRYIRVYNLIQQELINKLLPGVKWISSMDVHPQGACLFSLFHWLVLTVLALQAITSSSDPTTNVSVGLTWTSAQSHTKPCATTRALYGTPHSTGHCPCLLPAVTMALSTFSMAWSMTLWIRTH